MDVTIDTETLALETNAIVVSVGIVCFNPEDVDSFEHLVSRGSIFYLDKHIQRLKGRIETRHVMDWWAKQGREAREQLEQQGGLAPAELADCLRTYPSQYGGKSSHLRWYCRGPHFDIAKLEDLFWQFDVEAPWHYRKPRCSRTVLDEYGVSDDMRPVYPDGMLPHNPLHDAAFEAYLLQRARNGVPLEFKKAS